MQNKTNGQLLYNRTKPPLQVSMNIADYACPVHTEVRSHNAVKCAKCGMALEKTN